MIRSKIRFSGINPKALRAFRDKVRDDHDWIKKISGPVLDVEIARLGHTFTRPDKPMLVHQKACFLLGVAFPAFGFFLDMGLGKTRLSLELIRYWESQGQMKVALVMIPSESAVISWENQLREWGITIPFISLMNSPSADKWQKLQEFESGIILATYPGLSRMLTKLVKVKDKNKMKLQPNPALIRRLAKLVNILVWDECTKLGRKGSIAYRLAYQLSKTAPIRYGLAGRPFGRDPTMLWSQLYLIDRGETLGDTLGLFRSAFFDQKQGYFGGTEYKFNRDLEADLNRILKHRSITYTASECIDTPRVMPRIEPVLLPAEAKAYYVGFVKQIRARYAGYSERKNAFVRMRQVSSGFVGFLDDETGERAEIAFATNPKLERLMEFVQDMPTGRKFVIFYEFTYSGRLICEALTKAKIKHVWGWGGTKDARKFQDDFDHNEHVHGAVVNHKWGSYALNMQRGNYVFVYEAPVPAIDDEQMRKRVPRQGQTRTVFQTDLICKGTVDLRILEFHREGDSLFTALMKNPSAALAGLDDDLG